jgi:hypothetical protein
MITNRHREVVMSEEACSECQAPFLFNGGCLALARPEVQN